MSSTIFATSARSRLGEAGAYLLEIVVVGEEKANRAEGQRNADLKAHACGMIAVLLHVAEQRIGIDGIAREAEPPARITEAHVLHAGPYTKAEFIVAAARPPFFHAVLRRRILDRFDVGMTVEHPKRDAIDPVAPRAHLAVGHVVEPLPERADRTCGTIAPRFESADFRARTARKAFSILHLMADDPVVGNSAILAAITRLKMRRRQSSGKSGWRAYSALCSWLCMRRGSVPWTGLYPIKSNWPGRAGHMTL